jgi:5-methylcytosine-specific restriction endonuclease McrA
MTCFQSLREAIHAREGGVCFYCLRPLNDAVKCLDHVVPRAALGRNCYRNLVSSCMECNSQKGEREAEEFFRQLYRDRRLTVAELTDRLCALEALSAGKLRPRLAALAKPASELNGPLGQGFLPTP